MRTLLNRVKKQPEVPNTIQDEEPKSRFRFPSLEILLFVALGVFGFAIVSTLLNERAAATQPVLQLEVPAIAVADANPSVGIGLYEAESRRVLPDVSLSPVFTPSVQYWRDDIIRWAADYLLDPNLAATVMQIESCGNPTVSSSAGASGLFQVMPFHFIAGENALNPDTNALRGLAYLASGLEQSDGHAGLALAGYNGGHGLISRDYANWPYESQRYYRWGSGIYREASAGWDSSPTLQAWLNAGGSSLCNGAEAALGI